MQLKQYRLLLREITKASIVSRSARPGTVAASFRDIFQSSHQGKAECFEQDVDNVLTFMRSQRMHKTLLERYNPLHDLTTEQRVKATARRVGLDMPVRPEEEE